MLLEFTVENFRSFRERQSFSMLNEKPSEDTIFFDRTVETGFRVAPFLNRQACIFGANGAGKSSLVDAMSFVSKFVRTSVRGANGEEIRVEPFMYSEDWKKKPSKFEVAFIYNDTLYHCGIEVSRDRVEEEWMHCRPKSTGRMRQLYFRRYDSETQLYEWDINSSLLKGERGQWRAQTRPNALFLTTAVQFNGGVLNEPFEWLANRFQFLTNTQIRSKSYTAGLLDQPDRKKEILDCLYSVGLKLADINVKEVKFDLLDDPRFAELSQLLKASVGEGYNESKSYEIEFVRKSNDGELIATRIETESIGTQVLFGLIGPILDILRNGYTVVADDFGLGLHPLILRKLVSFFNEMRLNKNNAQLILATHDANVVDDIHIGYDEIWLLQKKNDLATRVYPFAMFKGQQEGTFCKKYLGGLFGAVPIVT